MLSILIFLLVPLALRITTSVGRVWTYGVHMVVVYRIDSIATGLVLAFARKYHSAIWKRLASRAALSGGLVLISAMIVYIFHSGHEHFATFSGWQCGFFFVLLNISCALPLPWFASIATLPEPALAIFTRISLLSYSLSLCHLPFMDFTSKAFFHLGIPPYNSLRLVTWIAGSFACATLTWRFVEQPFLRLRDARKPGVAAARTPNPAPQT